MTKAFVYSNIYKMLYDFLTSLCQDFSKCLVYVKNFEYVNKSLQIGFPVVVLI